MESPAAGRRPRRLDAADERRLARLIEAGVMARHALTEGLHPCGASDRELELIAAQGDAAWGEFFQANIALVRSVVARWARRGDPQTEDLVHEGCLGLVEAIVRYDFCLGWRFSTLAWNLVAHHVRRAAVGNNTAGSGTVAHARRVAQIEAVRQQESSRLGRGVDDREVALIVGRPLHSVRRDLCQARRADADLDTIEHERPETGIDISFLAGLSRAERQVLVWNFGIGADRSLTLVEIAELLGMSVSAVSRMKQRALRRGRLLVEQERAA